MRTIVVFIFFLLSFATHATELDSLHRALRLHAKEDSSRVNTLIELCRFHRSNSPDSGLYYGNKALQLARKTGNKKSEGKALYNLGVTYFYKTDYQKSDDYFDQAIVVGKEYGLNDLISDALKEKGFNQHYQGNFIAALNFYFPALELAEKSNDTARVVRNLNNIGFIYQRLGDSDMALHYLQKADDLSRSPAISYTSKSNTATALASIYRKKKKYDKALKYLFTSLKYDEQQKSKFNIALANRNIANCYIQMGQLHNAEPYIELSHRLSVEIKNKSLETSSLLIFGELRLGQKRIDEAIDFAEKALSYSIQANEKGEMLEAYLILAKSYSRLGISHKANDFWQKAYILNDSIKGEEIARSIADIQKGYELATKQSKINDLTLESERKDIQLEQEKNLKYFLMIVLILILVIAAFAWYNYYIKAKLNKELNHRYNRIQEQKAVIESINLELQEKAFRAQINPHFIFNCLNSIQYLIVNGENNEAFSYLTKFSILLRRILDQSDKEKIPLSEEMELLQVYLELESLRFDHNFNYHLEHNDVGSVFIPPLMIQPLVENAIVHGLLPKEGERKLGISFKKQEKTIICEIRDNGIGREAAKKNRPARNPRHQSKGVELSRQRLTVHNNKVDEGVFTIEDLYDDNGNPLGTSVTLKIADVY